MSASPPAVHSTKRKRKAPRIVVDSEDESEHEEQQNTQDVQSPVSKATPKKAAVTRKPSKRKGVKPDPDHMEQNIQETSEEEDKPKKRERAKVKDAREVTNEDGDGERPAKRQKLPPIKKKLPPASTGPSGNGTPLQNDKSAPTASSSSSGLVQRKIVDGPISNDMDLRDPDAFAQLFKKSGTGKSDVRYDLTSREKSAKQRAELLKLRAEYITEKARNKPPVFDLGSQNRKLVDVENRIRAHGSRVCVQVVGSCIMQINPEWGQLSARMNKKK